MQQKSCAIRSQDMIYFARIVPLQKNLQGSSNFSKSHYQGALSSLHGNFCVGGCA